MKDDVDSQLIRLFKTEEVPISQIKCGDVIVTKKGTKTVGKNDIQKDSFFKYTLFGDSYRSGTIPVVRFITDNKNCMVLK